MVELLIAASIVAVALLAISLIFPVASSNIDVGGDETAATAVGQGFTEMIRSVDFPTLTSFNGLNSGSPATCPTSPANVTAACLAWINQVSQLGDPPLTNGRAQVLVTTAPGPTMQQLATVTVTVSYSPREAWFPNLMRRSVTFVTWRSQ